MHNIGFIGAGTIAQSHAEAVSEAGGNIAAVADIDETAREAFAADYDVPDTYEDYEVMLDEADINVVLVAVPNALHADCAIAALERDVNVFVEKPLADSLEAAERVLEADAESDATAMVGFTHVFTPHTQAVKRRIDDGELGDIYDVNLEYVRRRGIPQLGSWFTRKDISGGGALIDTGVHFIAVGLYLLDYPALETVSADASAHFGTKEEYTYLSMWGGDPVGENPTFDVDDTVRALARTVDGQTVHLDCAWASNREPRHGVQVLGDEAGAELPVHGDTTTIYSDDKGDLTDTEISSRDRDAMTAEWDYLFDVLDGERDHDINTVEQGVAVQRFIDAIYRSAETDREVVLK